jgi:two-component system sensor histidine kinase ChiS
VAVLVVDRLDQQRYERVREARILRSLSSARARLEGKLNERLFLTRGLVAYVSTHPNISVGEFQRLASVLFSQTGVDGIRSIQLAKDTVVSHVYPVKGNEAAIGLKLLEMPDQSAAVRRATDRKTTVVAGPVKLVQGGTPFISRTPIYLTTSQGPPNSGEYWGLATILIDDKIIFSQAGISENTDDLEFALRGRDGMGAGGEVFFGDPGVFASNPLLLDIQVPGGTWQLAAVPLPGVLSGSPNLWLLRLGGSLLAKTSGLLAFFVTQRYRQRTEDRLRTGESRYRALAELSPVGMFQTDADGKYVFVNERWSEISGLRPEQALGDSWAGGIHPGDRHRVANEWSAAVKAN